jgi:hypothetical protein
MSEVRELQVVRRLPGAPVAGVIELLTQMLEHARAGRIRAMVFAYVDGAGDVVTGLERPEGEMVDHHLAAAASYLQHDILAMMRAAARQVTEPPAR